MGVSESLREQVYRAYMEFFAIAKRTRRWSIFDDIPWDNVDPGLNTEEQAICLETFCGVEMYVPDYTSNGFNLTRPIFGQAWFQACWGYEESKHALVFREYLLRSGMRTQEQYAEFEAKVFSKRWTLPFQTRRQMTCYGALQEMATHLIYATQREKCERSQNRVLGKIFSLVGTDEAAHYGFYKKVLKLELDEDRQGTLEDLALVLFNFRMPGVDLIPEYDGRLGIEGVGLSTRTFLKSCVFPTLRSLGTSRVELIKALREKKQRLPSSASLEEASSG